MNNNNVHTKIRDIRYSNWFYFRALCITPPPKKIWSKIIRFQFHSSYTELVLMDRFFSKSDDRLVDWLQWRTDSFLIKKNNNASKKNPVRSTHTYTDSEHTMNSSEWMHCMYVCVCVTKLKIDNWHRIHTHTESHTNSIIIHLFSTFLYSLSMNVCSHHHHMMNIL